MNDYFYQVLEGTIQAKVTDKETKETQIVDILNPGEIFGEIPFLLGLVSNITLEATSDALVVAVVRSKLEKFIMEKAEFGVSFFKFLARSLFTSLFNLQFCGQLEVLSEKTPVVAPIVDLKTIQLCRSPLPTDSPTLRTRQKNPTSHSSLPNPITPTTVELSKTEISTSKDIELPSNEKSSESSFLSSSLEKNIFTSSPLVPTQNEWVSVSKRSSPTVPRRALMSRRVAGGISNQSSSQDE